MAVMEKKLVESLNNIIECLDENNLSDSSVYTIDYDYFKGVYEKLSVDEKKMLIISLVAIISKSTLFNPVRLDIYDTAYKILEDTREWRIVDDEEKN